MAVAYDTASATQTISNVSTIPTINHTASGSDRYVRFSAGWAKLGTATLTATYGGNAMTAVGEAVAAASWGSGVTGRAKIFGYIAPATSSEAVVGTFTVSGNYGACGVVSYTGVDQTTPDGAAVSATGFSNAPSVTVTDATTGDMVSDALATEGGASLTAGQTQRFSANSSGYRGAGQDAAGSGSVAMGWSLPSSVNWAQVAAAIFQASGGGATNLTVPDSSHAHTLDNAVLTTSTTLAVQDMAHGHAMDAPTLSTDTALVVADSSHAHALDAADLSTDSYLVAADMAHSQALDNVTVTLDGANLVAADLAHAHALDNAALTLDTYLAIADMLHGHALDNVAISIPTDDLFLILKILRNRQELNAATGTFTLYDDDGTTVLYQSNAWADAAGTIPYSGGVLARIDALA